MRKRRQPLGGLAVLERVITEQARIALELRASQYVDAFNGAIRDGLEAAQDGARAFLGKEPWWYELLEGVLAVELAMDEATRALSLARSHRGNGIEDGQLLEYHLNHWLFQTHALIEKSIYLTEHSFDAFTPRHTSR